MLMQKIRDNAGWVVGIAVVCFGALIFVDWGMSPGGGLSQKMVVGTVSGEDISHQEFEALVQRKSQAENEKGQESSAERSAMLRRSAFDELVQERLFTKAVTDYRLAGTPDQILDFLAHNPPPGIEKAPDFMGPDSQFDKGRYLQWITDPRTFQTPVGRMLEAQTGLQYIPEMALGQIVATGLPTTDLEAEFTARVERTRAFGLLVAAPVDSFPVPRPAVTEVRAEFDALKDSFWVGKSVASIAVAGLRRQPSPADSLRSKQDVDSLAARIKRGEKFEELAQTYSEDPGSAKKGGSLGGPQPLNRWVPIFGQTARQLNKGEVSAPVLSQFGYHIIRCVDKIVKPGPTGEDTLYDLQHILVTVATSPETQEKLRHTLDTIRAHVKAGASFAQAAAQLGAHVDSLRVQEGEIGQGAFGMVAGASNWAFRPRDKDTISPDVLENTQFYMLLGKVRVQKPGRDFEMASNVIGLRLQQKASLKLASAHLTASLGKIKACDTSVTCIQAIGKLVPTVLTQRPAASWLPGLGYAPLGLFTAWNTAAKTPKTWVTGEDAHGALAVRLDSVQTPSATDISETALEQRRAAQNAPRAALQDWLIARRLDARVKNNLDQFYRD